MDITNHSSQKNKRNKRQKKNTILKDDRSKKLKPKKTHSQSPKSSLPSTPASIIEDNQVHNHHPESLIFDSPTTSNNNVKYNINTLLTENEETQMFSKIEDHQKTPQIVNSDDSDISSEEKEYSRRDRKPLPLIFDQYLRIHNTDSNDYNNGSSSDASVEDTKKTESNKCVYLGERETLRSFWDKCLYQCFKSKRCVAGEKPKRKYRKKPKISKPPVKKRKHLDPPLSCIDTNGTTETHNNDYLSRYEMLLYMDPLADSITPWQRKDFEMVFRMVKPTDIFALETEDKNDTSTDYTNSDTDQETYD